MVEVSSPLEYVPAARLDSGIESQRLLGGFFSNVRERIGSFVERRTRHAVVLGMAAVCMSVAALSGPSGDEVDRETIGMEQVADSNANDTFIGPRQMTAEIEHANTDIFSFFSLQNVKLPDPIKGFEAAKDKHEASPASDAVTESSKTGGVSIFSTADSYERRAIREEELKQAAQAEVWNTTLPELDKKPDIEDYELFLFDKTPGEEVGRIFTPDGLIDTRLFISDSLSAPKQPYVEDPELDYVHDGAAISIDYGLPGERGNAVVRAHNSTKDMDYFRNLQLVEDQDILYLEYIKDGYKDVLRYRAIDDPIVVASDPAGVAEVYIDGERDGYASTITTATCNTLYGDKNDIAYVVWALEEVEAINVPLQEA